MTWRFVAIFLGAWIIGDAIHAHYDRPKRTIIVVPMIMEQGGGIVPADPGTGASEAPREQECCARADKWRI